MCKTCKIECLIEKCKAKCCYSAPLPIEFVKTNSDKILNPVYGYVEKYEKSKQAWFITEVIENGDSYDADLSKQICPFLNKETLKCNVYDIRPELCREFGNHNQWDNMLTCFFMFGLDNDTRDFTEQEKEISNKKYMMKLPKLINELI